MAIRFEPKSATATPKPKAAVAVRDEAPAEPLAPPAEGAAKAADKAKKPKKRFP